MDGFLDWLQRISNIVSWGCRIIGIAGAILFVLYSLSGGFGFDTVTGGQVATFIVVWIVAEIVRWFTRDYADAPW